MKCIINIGKVMELIFFANLVYSNINNCLQYGNEDTCIQCVDGYELDEHYQCNKQPEIAPIIGIVLGSVFGLIVSIIVIHVMHHWCCKNTSLRNRFRQSKQTSSRINTRQYLQDSPQRVKWVEKQNKKVGQKCAICLQSGNLFVQCGHVFHPQCLGQWLKRNKQCPVCRCSITSQDATIFCEKCHLFAFQKQLSLAIKLQRKEKHLCNNCKC